MKPIRLAEPIFRTIQGEGLFAGSPSLFIRTSGCQLRCSWCDTMYSSWSPEGSTAEVVDLCEAIGAYPHRHIVITGGEPMLYAEQVGTLCEVARKLGKMVTIETNGVIFNESVKPELWSVSPKLASSAPEGGKERAMHLRNNTGARYEMFRSQPNVQFKFVLSSQQDVDEVAGLVAEHGLLPQTVWAMPEGVTRERVLERGAWLAEVCKERGWNLCLRNHVLLWGHRRGV